MVLELDGARARGTAGVDQPPRVLSTRVDCVPVEPPEVWTVRVPELTVIWGPGFVTCVELTTTTGPFFPTCALRLRLKLLSIVAEPLRGPISNPTPAPPDVFD